jgi:trigger factor
VNDYSAPTPGHDANNRINVLDKSMQIEQTSAEGLTRAYKITVEAAVIEQKLNEKLVKIAGEIKIDGFRPGKVPVSHVRNLHGDAVMGEVLEETVNTTSQEALDKDDVRPAMQPDIEITSFEKGSDLEYSMNVEIMPDIETADFSKMSVEKEVAKVADSDIDDAIKNLAEQQTRYEKSKDDGHAAADGDAVLIDFTGKLDGEVFDGGAAEQFQLVIGSNSFIPGFEEQLVGIKAGDEKDLPVTFPEDYNAAHLAGKDVVFEVKVHEVQQSVDVEINDELAVQVGLTDLAELRGKISEQIGGEFGQFTRAKMKRSLLDQLADSHEFDVPPGMVTMEFDQIWTDFTKQLESQEKTIEDEDQSEEDLREEYQAMANRRVRLGLLLAHVGDTNEITVSAEELNGAIMQEAQRYPGQEQQVFQFYQQNQEAMQQLRAPLYEDKVIDFILELATVTEKEVDQDTLMALPGAEEEEKKPVKKKAAAKKKPAAKKKAAAKKK